MNTKIVINFVHKVITRVQEIIEEGTVTSVLQPLEDIQIVVAHSNFDELSEKTSNQ